MILNINLLYSYLKFRFFLNPLDPNSLKREPQPLNPWGRIHLWEIIYGGKGRGTAGVGGGGALLNFSWNLASVCGERFWRVGLKIDRSKKLWIIKNFFCFNRPDFWPLFVTYILYLSDNKCLFGPRALLIFVDMLI